MINTPFYQPSGVYYRVIKDFSPLSAGDLIEVDNSKPRMAWVLNKSKKPTLSLLWLQGNTKSWDDIKEIREHN